MYVFLIYFRLYALKRRLITELIFSALSRNNIGWLVILLLYAIYHASVIKVVIIMFIIVVCTFKDLWHVYEAVVPRLLLILNCSRWTSFLSFCNIHPFIHFHYNNCRTIFCCVTNGSTKEFNRRIILPIILTSLLLGFIATWKWSLVYKANSCIYLVIRTCVSHTLLYGLMTMHIKSLDIFRKQIVNVDKWIIRKPGRES